MTDEEYWTVRAMEKFGGSFVHSLAEALFHADQVNFNKIKQAFPEYWKEYTEMATKWKMKENENTLN